MRSKGKRVCEKHCRVGRKIVIAEREVEGGERGAGGHGCCGCGGAATVCAV